MSLDQKRHTSGLNISSNDYILCAKCNRKVIYAASLDYDLWGDQMGAQGLILLCSDCDEEHEIKINKVSGTKVTIKDLLKKHGSTKALSFAGSISEAQVRNLKAQGREVERLENGDYILLSKQTIIFKEIK